MKRCVYYVVALCLFHHAQAGLEDSLSVDGVNYALYSADAASSLITDGDPCAEGILANWESEAEYKLFIDEMVSQNVDPGNYHVGVIKRSNTVYLRTYTGGRLVPFTNSYLTYGDKTVDHCVQLEFDTDLTHPKYRNFYMSPWTVGNDCDVDVGDLFICMEKSDPTCTNNCLGTLNTSPIPDPDREFGTCFWHPYPGKVFTHTAAVDICGRYGGHLMNLLVSSDMAKLDSLVNKEQSWNRYWLGLIQKPGESHPHWWEESYVFLHSAWEIEVNYGSALNTVPYAGLWDVGMAGMDLWMTAPFVESEDVVYDGSFGNRDNREAFVLCEATFESHCLTHSPNVAYAIKTGKCCNKIVYTCMEGWEFPDGNQQKDTPCTCGNTTFSDDIPDCIFKNPCKSDPNPCGPHGHCISNNQYPDPYHCLCMKGYSMSPSGQCVDINECEDNPCSAYFGHCINMEGSYWCQCTQGYGWDSHGQCKALSNPGGGNPAVHTLVIHFYVQMGYDPRMNEQHTDPYNHLKAALDAMTLSIYGDEIPVTMDSFQVVDESDGKVKIRVVFNIYVQADVTRLSVYAWGFHNYVKVTVSNINVNGRSYPFYGSIYIYYHNKNIEITSLCSIFNAISQCHGSQCSTDEHEPHCVCQVGYYGDFCKDTDHPQPHKQKLSDTEIGLIAAVCVLFLLVICMPLCIWCCFKHCRSRPHHYGSHHYPSLFAPPVLRSPMAPKWRYH